LDFFDETLPLLGVHIQSSGGKLPLTIQGPILPRSIQVDGSVSSQFLTGLLMAFASLEQVTATVNVSHLTSKPYVDLTLEILRAFGLNTPINHHYESFVFAKRNTPPSDKVIHYTVESDWSGAAFLLIAGAIAGHIVVKGLDLQSTQADRKILDALRSCGCTLSISNQAIDIAPPAAGLQDLKPFQFDATDCPDLFPPLVALASYCKGTSVILGVNRLAHKESDRGLTLQEEFGKAGVEIVLENNVMLVHGGNGLQGGKRHSHHDHRIAMACAVAALKAEGHTTIEGADAINKSYPNFYQHLQQLGGKVQVRACEVPP
jgi:3-phosphoshikimate 1-carboxyvinyltransferase